MDDEGRTTDHSHWKGDKGGGRSECNAPACHSRSGGDAPAAHQPQAPQGRGHNDSRAVLRSLPLGAHSRVEARQAEDSLVLVDLAIMSNRVSLHRALGGGWEERGEKVIYSD